MKQISRFQVPALIASLAVLPPAQADADRVLLFTKTTGYRHESIPAAVEALGAIAARHGLRVDHSEDGAVFRPESLSGYRLVAFLNTTGDVLDTEQQHAFERFIQAGGGFLGVHSAADTEYDWSWYGELVGAFFKSHPPGFQTGTVRFAAPPADSAVTEWRVTDEFYNFRANPRGKVTVVATLHEREDGGGEMGADHPIAWCRAFDGGRSWYTGLGHRPELYADVMFVKHLEQGFLYAASRSDRC